MELYEVMLGKLLDGSGVYPKGIVQYFNEHGYIAKYKEQASIDGIKYKIFLGAPIIIDIHVEEPTQTVPATYYVLLSVMMKNISILLKI